MKKGFTLIELLVVIAIIALLSTLSVVALNSARVKARDARRVSDIKQIRTALDMYFDNTEPNAYPAGSIVELGSSSALCLSSDNSFGGTCAGTVFMQSVPKDPLATGKYLYTAGTGQATYTITYKLEKNAASSIATPVTMEE
jgi:prepilin-type N-terminal cleavage/methylation domain-containing protein